MGRSSSPMSLPPLVHPFQNRAAVLPGGLDYTRFGAMIKDGSSFSRTTADNRVLTYILNVIQQPQRARACGSSAKSVSHARPVDPPPLLSLLIFELRNGIQTDITFSYDALFFVFASLEVAQVASHGRFHLEKNPPIPILTGHPVSGGCYLDRPHEGIFFPFPNLSVKYEGRYRLCFNLYETIKNIEDHERTGNEPPLCPGPAISTVSPSEVTNWRLEIKSDDFLVYMAKKFPGLTESTPLTRILAEQGCRVRVRRDVRARRKEHSGFEDESYGSLHPTTSSPLGRDVLSTSTILTAAEKMEAVHLSGQNTYLGEKEMPPPQQTPAQDLGPATTPPLVSMVTKLSHREGLIFSEQPRPREEIDGTATTTTVSSVSSNENTIQSPDANNQHQLENLPSEGDNSVPKLRRIACIVCRVRKLKCDGTKPTCSPCTRLGLICTYYEARRESGAKRGHTKAPEERLKHTETLLKTRDPAVSTRKPVSKGFAAGQGGASESSPDSLIAGHFNNINYWPGLAEGGTAWLSSFESPLTPKEQLGLNREPPSINPAHASLGMEPIRNSSTTHNMVEKQRKARLNSELSTVSTTLTPLQVGVKYDTDNPGETVKGLGKNEALVLAGSQIERLEEEKRGFEVTNGWPLVTIGTAHTNMTSFSSIAISPFSSRSPIEYLSVPNGLMDRGSKGLSNSEWIPHGLSTEFLRSFEAQGRPRVTRATNQVRQVESRTPGLQQGKNQHQGDDDNAGDDQADESGIKIVSEWLEQEAESMSPNYGGLQAYVLPLDPRINKPKPHESDDKSPKRCRVILKEAIWSAIFRCWRRKISESQLEDSANETEITPVNGEPRSYTIKRSSQEWWLAHASEPWENVLPGQDMATPVDRQLLHLIFSSWHQEWMAGARSLPGNADWMFPLDTILNQEERVVERLVHDVFLHLGRATAGSVSRTPAGSSTSDAPSRSPTRPHQKSSDASNITRKRRDRQEAEPGDDGLDGDEPNQNDRTKRIKKTTDEYNRYVICTQFAAGQEPTRPNCFFGAWCSVDRLKQDHLINVHNFNTSQLKIDRGGTEAEKWWRLFDKLNPGIRIANPEAFIPGPFWEDRVAHNTYNRIFSEAMKRAEEIRERRTQSLASDIQALLNRQRDVERQEIRQVVIDILHPGTGNTNSSESPSSVETMEPESDSFHYSGGRRSTPPVQQPDTQPMTSSTLSNRHLPVVLRPNAPDPTNSSILLSLHGTLPDVLETHASSSWGMSQDDDLGMGTQSTHNSLTPQASSMLGVQFGADLAMTTASSSETMSGTFSAANDYEVEQPFGKVCRCRFHSIECDRGVRDGNEWCACCSGWFPWSAFADGFLR